MKACDRGLITLLGKWRQRMKWSDYQSSPLVWLGGSSPPLKFRKVFLAIELTFLWRPQDIVVKGAEMLGLETATE